MEKGAEVVGYRPEVKEGYCWWTYSDWLLCSDHEHEGSLDEAEV